jgi:hypothetical protein
MSAGSSNPPPPKPPNFKASFDDTDSAVTDSCSKCNQQPVLSTTYWQVWWVYEGKPSTFSHASDPLEADDWLRAVER